MSTCECVPARISGLLIGPEGCGPPPLALVRARAAERGELLAETYSAADGQFALCLPLAGPGGAEFRLPIRVEVLDCNQTLLCEAAVEISPGEQAGRMGTADLLAPDLASDACKTGLNSRILVSSRGSGC